jgi:hypothetical protein
MRDRAYYDKNRYRLSQGIAEMVDSGDYLIDQLRDSEWSIEFETLMRNRLVMGALRYGKLHASGKPPYDRVTSCKRRLDLYAQTGNLEYLVDAANMCLLEFEESVHPLRHWESIDDGEHVTIKNL